MVSSHVRALFDVWFSFHIVGGHFLVPVLIVTFLVSKAKRDATLINFGIMLSLSSVFNCLLSASFSPSAFNSSLTRLPQDSTRKNTSDPNQTRDCVFFRPQHLAHLLPCPSFPIPSHPSLNVFAFPRWSVGALTLILQIRSRVELKPVRGLYVVRFSHSHIWSRNMIDDEPDARSSVHILYCLPSRGPGGTFQLRPRSPLIFTHQVGGFETAGYSNSRSPDVILFHRIASHVRHFLVTWELPLT